MSETWNESGTKKYHLGHLFRDCMLKDSDAVCQIDAATGQEETRGSVLRRATALAWCLRTLGLKPGDVLALGGDNHLDVHIPFYAALMNGYPISGVDPLFKFDEIIHLFRQTEPKIAFCQQSSYDDYRRAVRELGLDTRVYTFNGDGNTMTGLIQQCDVTDLSIDEFQVADFDLDTVFAFLISTSGTTGHPKVAAIKHQPAVDIVKMYSMGASEKLTPALTLSAVQWVSAYFNAVGLPSLNHVKVQTSAPATPEHVIDIINKYRPVSIATSPSILHRMLLHEKPCDWTCFDAIYVSGACIHKSVLVDLKAVLRPDAMLIEAYGQTETLGPVLRPASEGPLGNCGAESPLNEIKLVDPVTGETVMEPNVPGELWCKGPRFSEYYNNPEETAAAVTADGWYKSGDLLRRDEDGYYFFVDRLKMLIKFRNYKVFPLELEELIIEHDGVQDVCVTSIPHPVDGEWPVAVVVRRPGASVTAQEIKDLVASKLSKYKQLVGGVVFVDELPMSNGKIARAKVKQLASITTKHKHHKSQL